MKNTLLLTICALFLSNLCFAQEKRSLPESLNAKEVRIFKTTESGKTEVIRIFERSDLKWEFELYDTDLQGNLYYREGTAISDPDIWLKILETNIGSIPDQKQINYKFRKSREIALSDNTQIISYDKPQVIKEKENYHFFFREKDKINNVIYSNPDLYLNMFPEIDELVSVVRLLDLIRDEFCESTLPRKLCKF